MENLTTHRSDEFSGEIVVDYAHYWETLVAKHLDTSRWIARGFAFDVDTRGQFSFRFIVSAIDADINKDGPTPVQEVGADVSLNEFLNSFVLLKARAFYGQAHHSNFESTE